MNEEGFEPTDTGSAYTRFEERNAIEQAMKSMNGKHRLVLMLRYFHELTYEEIAQILDIPVGTVKSRLNTAIKTLRGALVSGDGK